MSYIAPRWPIPPDVKWIGVNGYPMAYQDHGSGVPLVLVHGSFCDYRVWPDQIEPFSKKHRVINVSLRHYFPEIWDGVGNDFSFAQQADDVGAFIQKLRLGKVHLLGHSRGGVVVIEVAKKHPDLIRTLILEDASVRLELPETEENLKAAAFRANLLNVTVGSACFPRRPCSVFPRPGYCEPRLAKIWRDQSHNHRSRQFLGSDHHAAAQQNFACFLSSGTPIQRPDQ